MRSDGPRIDLANTPSGLAAHAVQRTRAGPDGTRIIVLQRGSRLRTEQVDLLPTSPPAPLDLSTVPELTRAGDRTFVLGASRRSWTAVVRHFGPRAWTAAINLTRAGVVTLRCTVIEPLTLGAPTAWYRTQAAAEAAQHRSGTLATHQQELRDQLHGALASLGTYRHSPNVNHRADLTDDDLATVENALRHELRKTHPAPKRTLILCALTHDLCEGIVHLNARGFSQAHTGSTKTWDSARAILSSTGIPPAVATAIGLRRNSLIGIGGAITVHLGRQTFPFALFEEPVLLAAEQPGLQCTLDGTRLVIVENLQAAQTLCTTFRQASETRDTGIVYSGGMPSPAALHHIAALAEKAHKTVIAPDADLGGVRIASAIHDALPAQARTHALICDAGATTHKPQPPWPNDSCTWDGLRAALNGPAAALAQSCLNRGYPVEQEAAIVHSVSGVL